ncbi:MAG: hypothetical protein EXR20_08085 [Bacteroidetes bacterium]|nr:hypothetical protein [Bacteroidota bacterium]
MDPSIKDLIELSTSSGAIKQESRDFIYQKAEEKGISKTECDIYIENALNVITKQDVKYSDRSGVSRGWWFILIGIGDFIWGVSCMGSRYTEDMGVFGLISGVGFILVGTFLLGWLNIIFIKKLSFVIVSIFIAYVLSFIVFFPITWIILKFELFSIFDIFKIIATVFQIALALLVLYVFRHKILAEKANKIENTRLNAFLQPILNKLPKSILIFLEKKYK